MTEAEWLGCDDPLPMLAFLRGRASDRKLRLLACAFCRLIWHWMLDVTSRMAVETAERYADGLASDKQLGEIANSAWSVNPGEFDVAPALKSFPYAAAEAAGAVTYRDSNLMVIPGGPPQEKAARSALQDAAEAVLSIGGSDNPDGTLDADEDQQFRGRVCGLIRCVIGNPLRPRTLDTSWQTSNDATAPRLAETIYDYRDFERLPVLADALEDTGCNNVEILDHCRNGGEHARGCWVLDLLLGKQ